MKAKQWYCLLLAIVMIISASAILAACQKEETVTVTYYDGRTVLKTVQVKKGGDVEEFSPTKDGFDFRGWYTESSLAIPFKEGTKADKDINLFAQWRTQNPEPDNRMWYARGSIMNSKWTQLTNLNEKTLEWYKSKDETFEPLFFTRVEGKENVFTIELEIKYGEKFRFVTNMNKEDWTGDAGCAQLGLGNLIGFEYAAGVNPENSGKVDSADLYLYGEVKDSEGNVIFKGGYEYNMPAYTWNIWVTEGHSGVYRFTFQSFPGTDTTDEVEWEFVRAIEHDFQDKTNDGKCDHCGKTQEEHT